MHVWIITYRLHKEKPGKTCQRAFFLALSAHMDPLKKPLKVIACRDFGLDCNALMKGRTVDEAVDAAIKHGVSMHGQNVKELQTPEGRAAIADKAKDLEV
jgi:predicted small metal-binding protein